MKHTKEYFMRRALLEASKAKEKDEVPIGCVIVKDNKIIARGNNNRENKNDVSSHAEMEAIRKANKKLNSWRLVDCDLYVTIEPCLMCMGAIYQSHIRNVYYGSEDPKGGSATSVIEFDKIPSKTRFFNKKQSILTRRTLPIV